MKSTLNIITKLMQAVGFILFAVALFVPEAAEWLFGTGGLLAATPIAGDGSQTVQATEEQAPGHLKEDVSQLITKIEPNLYPFDTLTNNIGSDPAKNIKIYFEEMEYHKRNDTVVSTTVAAGDAGNSVDLEITKSAQWKKNDVAVLPDVTVTMDGLEQELVVKVIAVSNNEITVVPSGYADTDAKTKLTIPAIDGSVDPVRIFRQGTSVSETTAQTPARGLLPVQEWNYCQTFMAQIEESVLRSLMSTKSGMKTYTENQLLSIKNFRSEMDYAKKFGKRYTDTDTAGDQYWMMGGLATYDIRQLDYTKGALTNNAFIDWSREIFSDNNGSFERHLLADSYLLADILKVEIVKEQAAKEVKVKRGIRCKEIETNFGMLNITFDRSLNEIGRKHYGMVVDPKNIRKRPLEKMKVEDLDLNKTGQRRVNAKRIVETSSVEIRHLKTHAEIVGEDE